MIGIGSYVRTRGLGLSYEPGDMALGLALTILVFVGVMSFASKKRR